MVERLTIRNPHFDMPYALIEEKDITFFELCRPIDGAKVWYVSGKLVDRLAELEDALEKGNGKQSKTKIR